MSLLHQIVGALPKPLAISIERESRCWMLRCPNCSHEKSVWELNGVRWGACSKSHSRFGFCSQCQKNVWMWTYYRKGDSPRNAGDALAGDSHRPQDTHPKSSYVVTSEELSTTPARTEPMPSARLWIDGVGCWLAWWQPRLTIGGPSTKHAADLALLSNLQSLHAVIERSGEEYVLQPQGPTFIRDKNITTPTPLMDGDEFRLGDDVRLRFRLPSSLSNSALLEFVSDHRPSQRTDGIVLLDQTCLIGPGSDQHIRCRVAEDSMVLFLRDNALWVRSRRPLQVNGKQNSGPVRLSTGDVVRDESLTFRLELDGGV